MQVRLAFALWATGCAGDAIDLVPAPVEVEIGDEAGWVREVALDPSGYETVARSAPNGWAALLVHDYRGAASAFDVAGARLDATQDVWIGRGRAEFALAILYADLAAFSAVANEELYATLSLRGQLPPGPEAPLTAALAAYCTGGETASSWAHRVTGGPDQAIATAMTQGASAQDVLSGGPFGQRSGVHRSARTKGDPAPLLAVAGAPITTGTKPERAYWDPCLWSTLSDVWTARAVRDLAASEPLSQIPIVNQRIDRGAWRKMALLVAPKAALAGRLLAPWPSAADLRSELSGTDDPGLLGARAPSLRQIGLGTISPGMDDPQAAANEVHRFDAALDQVRKALATSPPGAKLVHELGLVERYRQEQLLVRARAALVGGSPTQAMAYLDLAEDPRGGIGRGNAPALYTLIARAELANRHPREAIAALQVVAARYPEVAGLIEVANELAALAEMAAPPAPPSAASRTP